MHVVYKITFNNRKTANTYPYYYIGSKSNCSIENGVIIDKYGNPYYGSSTWKNYNDIVENDVCYVDILYESDNYNDVLKKELEFQEKCKAVESIEYFNRSYATVSNFANPEYATYKHYLLKEKIVRLPRTHPLVLNGTFVGVTKGRIPSDEENKKRGRSGKSNAFYGKSHSEKTKTIIKKANIGKIASEETKQKMSKTRKGIPKSDEHKNKIGRKGLVMIQNIHTKEIKRVPKTELGEKYEESVWTHPKKLNPEKKIKCKYCDMESTAGNIQRWHNENCKHKDIQ